MRSTPLLPPLRLTAPLWLYLGLLLMGTLYPFEFAPGPPAMAQLAEFMQRLQHGPYVLFTGDFLSNILLFIPFGIIVSLHFPADLRKRLWPILVTVLLACLLSSLIEFAQLFARNRHSSAADVISNSIGGLAGSLTVGFWPRSFGLHPKSPIRMQAGWSSVLALSFLMAWLPTLIPVVFPAWHLPGLWAEAVTFNAGNDFSLTHPWYGRLHRVAIYTRALDSVEARQFFLMTKKGKPGFFRETDVGLVTLYDFDETQSTALFDRTGGGADLHLKGSGGLQWRPQNGGLALRHPARLSTSRRSGEKLSASLLKAREFSLEAWITPRNLIQRGPAYILSLGGTGGDSNLLLGQSTSDLVFWVRTPVSGDRLTALSATTKSQPLTRHLTQVIAVFREGNLEIFVNGVRSGSLNLRREAMIGLPARRTDGARIAYAFLYFFPFTLFWSSLLSRKRVRPTLGSRPLATGPWQAWLVAILLLLLSETLQASFAERPFDLSYLFLGIVVIAVAAVVGRLSSPIPRPE